MLEFGKRLNLGSMPVLKQKGITFIDLDKVIYQQEKRIFRDYHKDIVNHRSINPRPHYQPESFSLSADNGWGMISNSLFQSI